MNAQLQAWLVAICTWLASTLSTQTNTSPLPTPVPPSYPSPSATATATAAPTATPSSGPTPSFTLNPTQGSWPQAVTAIPTPAQITITLETKCVSNTTGATGFAITGAISIELGHCDGNVNPSDTTALAGVDIGNNISVPIVQSLGLWNNYPYFLALTQDNHYLTIYICQLPGINNCMIYQVVDNHPIAYSTTNGYIGGPLRILSNSSKVEYINVYNSALTNSVIQSLSNAANSTLPL